MLYDVWDVNEDAEYLGPEEPVAEEELLVPVPLSKAG
jgi:hypothetical protein